MDLWFRIGVYRCSLAADCISWWRVFSTIVRLGVAVYPRKWDGHLPRKSGPAAGLLPRSGYEIIVRMERRVGIALGILLACCGSASALNPSLDFNQYAHKAWTIRDGFFKGFIHAIAQTPDGYLWLGTEFGLVRFDGVRSIPWEPPAGEHLPSSDIRQLVAARDGRLLIGTAGGLASWKDGKLTHYPEFDGQSVPALLEDREGTVWAGVWANPTGRLCAIQSDNVHCYGEDGSLGWGVLSLYEDSRGDLWVGAFTGLWRWNPGPSKLYPMPSPEIRALINGDNGRLLISMPGGIRQLADRKAAAYPLPGVGQDVSPNGILRDRDGGPWIEPRPVGSCMYMREGRICFRSLTVSRASTSTVSMRIVKAVSGSQPLMASTAFAT